MVLKNCDPELSYTLAELWSSLVFQIVGRSHWWSMYLRMLRKGLLLKNTSLLVFCLWLVKSLKNLYINNRLVDHLEKCELFSDLKYGFRSSWSTVDLLTGVSDRIAWAFNRSRATWAVALDISKAFNSLQQSLACWSSSQTQVLWNFRSYI